MKTPVLGLVFLSAAWAQIPGLPNIPGTDSVKGKIDAATGKTKPITDRATRATDALTPWTPEEEKEIGEAAAAKMIAMFGLVDDAALQKYVNLVGQAVSQFAPRPLPYRFGALDTNIVGAYALPGGYIFITRGALAGMQNEAQLAGALGHEIDHASARHLETEIRGRKTSAWAVQELSPYTNRAPNITQLRADALLKDLFNTALSRAKENEADDIGTQMAAQAGYAGEGLLDVLKIMERSNSEPGNQRLFGQMLSTHPSFEDRIAHLSAMPQARLPGQTLEARFNRALGR